MRTCNAAPATHANSPYPETGWPPAAFPKAGHSDATGANDRRTQAVAIFPASSLKFLSATPAMTTTNQAFIKLYRHDAAASRPEPGAADDDRLSAVALGASVEIVGTAANYGSLARGPASIGESVFATTIDVLPPTAQPSVASSFLFKVGLDEGLLANRQPHTRQRPDAGTKTKRPLSAFLTRPARTTASNHKKNNSGRPRGTTVASFRWPAVCRALAQQSAVELNSVADLLLDQVELGHSLFGVMSLFPRGGATTALSASPQNWPAWYEALFWSKAIFTSRDLRSGSMSFPHPDGKKCCKMLPRSTTRWSIPWTNASMYSC